MLGVLDDEGAIGTVKQENFLLRMLAKQILIKVADCVPLFKSAVSSE